MNIVDTIRQSSMVQRALLYNSQTLQCHSCKEVSPLLQQYADPCEGKQQVSTCRSNETICLAATFTTHNKSSGFSQYETHKTCYRAGDDPCRDFLKSARIFPRNDPQVDFLKQCYTCTESLCNLLGIDTSGAAPLTLSIVTLVFGLFACFLYIIF
ncbi:hypothetical protein NQ317_006616 [Molorchus minor]|uniref:Uncharacterized protein n=1 Tax=Molorchus minor TaxID=1323400 RepID=A0ABQ9JZ18_9CUCU|nr:hypothetical protein NQ317_006616 [Molorchus minor]